YLCLFLTPSYSFNVHRTTPIYTLSLHDALPICPRSYFGPRCRIDRRAATHSRKCRTTARGSAWLPDCRRTHGRDAGRRSPCLPRSEEHTSELQSRENLVCRLLLEKKKTISRSHA